MNILRSFRNGLYLGCSMTGITVDAGGEVTQHGTGLSVQGAGDPAQVDTAKTHTTTAEDKPMTREEQEAALAAAAEAPTEEAPKEEDKPADETEKPKGEETKWADRDKAKDVPLTEEETARIAALANLNDDQRVLVTDATLEMKTTGDLSPESRAAAAKAFNVDPSMVDAYVEGLKAKAAPAQEEQPPALSAEDQKQYDARMTALYETAGSKENYAAFVDWQAKGGLTKAETDDLVRSIDASPQAGARALAAYMAKFNAAGGAHGGPARDLSHQAGAGQKPIQKVEGFKSIDEQNSALRATNERGQRKMEVDPAYRQEVENRMAVSRFAAAGANIMGGG